MQASEDFSIQELHQKARTCMEQRDLQGALNHISQLLEQLDPSESQTRAKTFANKGFLQAGLQRFDEAADSFQQASEIFENDNDMVGVAVQVGNIGSLHRDQGKFTEALLHYQKALVILKEEGAEPVIADQCTNIAYAYSQVQDIEAAVSYFQDAVEIYDKLGLSEKANQCRANIKILLENN